MVIAKDNYIFEKNKNKLENKNTIAYKQTILMRAKIAHKSE